jgi:hypothetical protein
VFTAAPRHGRLRVTGWSRVDDAPVFTWPLSDFGASPDAVRSLLQLRELSYGTSGFSMGGGGTTYAASEDSSLKSSVALMAWGPTARGVSVPTIFICGASDSIAACRSHSQGAYRDMPDTTPKMLVTVSGGHNGQPSAGRGMSGSYGLAFQKVFLAGDERWRSVLLSGEHDDTNIQ